MRTLNNYKGITLIESIVAVSLLAFAIAGPMTLGVASLRASRDARNELIATHLAEEAIEVIRSVRDNNSADDMSAGHDKWMQNIFDKCKSGCVFDITNRASNPPPNDVWKNNLLIQCPSGDCTNIATVYVNPTTGMYRQDNGALGSSWSPTNFRRFVTMEGVDDPTNPERQVRVHAVVTYSGFAGVNRSVTLSDDLYNWFPSLH